MSRYMSIIMEFAEEGDLENLIKARQEANLPFQLFN